MTYSLRLDSVYVNRFSWLIACLLLVFSSCIQHEEGEDHHLEHIIPAHKPGNYAEAVKQLEMRGRILLSGQLTEATRQELLDVIDWLPELAADSDLKRQQWEQVRDTGLELRQLAENPAAGDGQSKWNSLVDQLHTLVLDSDTRSQQVPQVQVFHPELGGENTATEKQLEEKPHD